MESLRIITEEHQNLWRIATTLDMVADEIDGGLADYCLIPAQAVAQVYCRARPEFPDRGRGAKTLPGRKRS